MSSIHIYLYFGIQFGKLRHWLVNCTVHLPYQIHNSLFYIQSSHLALVDHHRILDQKLLILMVLTLLYQFSSNMRNDNLKVCLSCSMNNLCSLQGCCKRGFWAEQLILYQQGGQITPTKVLKAPTPSPDFDNLRRSCLGGH